MGEERVFNFSGPVVFNDIHDNSNCTIIVPKGESAEDEARRETNREERVRDAIRSLRSEVKYKKDYAAIRRVMEDEGIYGKVDSRSFATMLREECKVEVDESTISKVAIVGRYPNWDVLDDAGLSDMESCKRMKGIAERFLELYGID